MKAWNESLINYVPLLCLLVESTADSLSQVLSDEQDELFLFQKPLAQIQEVCTYPSELTYLYTSVVFYIVADSCYPFSHRHFALTSTF